MYIDDKVVESIIINLAVAQGEMEMQRLPVDQVENLHFRNAQFHLQQALLGSRNLLRTCSKFNSRYFR